MIRELKDDGKSYIKIFLIGILVGCITRLLDYCSLDTLWSWSSIQTLLGFWMISNTIIVVKSSSNKCAGISSFLYMFGMTLSFYGLQVILGMFIPMFSDRFRFSLFIMFTILSGRSIIFRDGSYSNKISHDTYFFVSVTNGWNWNYCFWSIVFQKSEKSLCVLVFYHHKFLSILLYSISQGSSYLVGVKLFYIDYKGTRHYFN